MRQGRRKRRNFNPSHKFENKAANDAFVFQEERTGKLFLNVKLIECSVQVKRLRPIPKRDSHPWEKK